MSNSEQHRHDTQHAFLVVWGWFAEHLGLIQQLQAVSLKQKSYHHRPQTKVLEFLVAILAGLQHLQEISLAAHPLDKDQAVAQAWAQPAWADYSGVSRTLSGLSWEEVKQIVQALEQISQPYLTAEVKLLRFERDNAANAEAVEAEFRLDAGFGTYENVALLIEMGYELYTKPHSHKVVASLKQQVDDSTAWTRVGANAELVAWPRLQLKH